MGKQNYIIYSEREINGIRNAAQKAGRVLDTVCRSLRPGMSTLQLDQLAGQLIKDSGGESAFYNYHGFPAQICISVNDEVVHGIGRDDRIIKMGDIVSVDTGIRVDGYIGDTARTVSVGPPVGRVSVLMSVAKKSLAAGISVAISGNTVRDIGVTVENVVTSAGFSVVRDFVGHGCGVKLHEPPEVPNYPTKRAKEKLRPGMVLALEPMVNMGTHKVKIDGDGWTVRTADGCLSSHFEHMNLITDSKPEILTLLTDT